MQVTKMEAVPSCDILICITSSVSQASNKDIPGQIKTSENCMPQGLAVLIEALVALGAAIYYYKVLPSL